MFPGWIEYCCILWCIRLEEVNDHYWYNYPFPSENIQIPSPKKTFGGNYTKMRDFKTRMETESNNAGSGLSTVLRGDIVDSGSLPPLMLQFAISSMNNVVETANELADQERKPTMANFLMAFLMLVPVAGSVAGALGSTLLRTILNVAGELANIGVAIYEVVDDPNNALLDVFGLLLGGVSLKPFNGVAQARRSVKSREFEKLGRSKTTC